MVGRKVSRGDSTLPAAAGTSITATGVNRLVCFTDGTSRSAALLYSSLPLYSSSTQMDKSLCFNRSTSWSAAQLVSLYPLHNISTKFPEQVNEPGTATTHMRHATNHQPEGAASSLSYYSLGASVKVKFDSQHNRSPMYGTASHNGVARILHMQHSNTYWVSRRSCYLHIVVCRTVQLR